MCCAPVSMAAFAIRRHAASSGAACRLASSGAMRTARCSSTRTKPSSPPSRACSSDLPKPVLRAAFGCGSARKALNSRCRCTNTPRSAGSRPAITLSTACSPTPSMQAPMSMARREPRRHSTPRARVRGASGICRATSGKCSSRSIMKATSIGRPMKPTRHASPPIRPRPHNDPSNSGGAAREGSALLQGLASCGHRGRRLRTHYSGRNSAPGYHCGGEHVINGRGSYCLNIGGVQIDEAVTRAFIAALEPSKLAATVAAAERLEADREAALKQWRLGVERANYEASRAERRYRAVDPDNRLVARGLEREWEESLSALEAARSELARREAERPRV